MKPERTKEEIVTELIRAINPKWDYGKDDEEVFRSFWYFFNPEPARTIIRKAMEEYRQSSPVESKWVSVKERLPKEGTRVLVAYKFGVAEGFYWGAEFLKDLQTPFPEPSHWQPLPELPPIEEPKEK